MKRAAVFALIGGVLLVASVGVGVAAGYPPASMVAGLFEDACDAPTPGESQGANATSADPCGDGDGESNDDE